LIILTDKPVGVRSSEAVAEAKRRLCAENGGKKIRVGHAGTLDSTASGLLIILAGTATRLSDYIMKLPKVYEAEVRLGRSTDTCDASGETVFEGDAGRVTEAVFDRVLFSFLGVRDQTPPEISALKLGGVPLHKIARAAADKVPAINPRPVCVYSIVRRGLIADGRVRISVTCGKGTYIRAIARDIGVILGCGAHVESLRRLSVGRFSVSDAGLVKPTREAGEMFQRLTPTEETERRLIGGMSVPLRGAGRYVPGSMELRHGLCIDGARLFGFAEVFRGDGSAGDGDGRLFIRPAANIEIAT
jgi:tRNA pseudouridine(55) synthase